MPDKEVQTCHPFRCTSARWEITRTKRDEAFAVSEMLADEPYIVWRGEACKLKYSIVKTTL
jgi:predicted nucleotidyltransferase